MNRLSRVGLILIVLCGLWFPAGASAQQAATEPITPRLVEQNTTGLVFELAVPLPEIQAMQVEGQQFVRLSLPSYTTAGAAGQPELLQTGVMLGIPADGEVALRILEAKVEDVPGVYTIYPNPQHVVLRDPDSGEADALSDLQEQFTWDRTAYAADEFQPSSVITVDDTAFVRGQRVARILIRPVQYNPAQGALRVYRYLRVEATFSGASADDVHTPAAPDLFDPILRDQLLNFDQALAWRSERGQPVSSRAPDSIYPGDTSRTWFKTNLRASGLYKVTLDELQGADLAPLAAANPAYLQVWTHGQQVAAAFVGDGDAQFEAGEALLFYADIEPTIYSDTDVYWLSVGDTPGLRMTSANAAPAGAVTDSAAWTTVHIEQDTIFRGYLPAYNIPNTYPRWYWVDVNSLFTTGYSVLQTLPAAVTTGYNATLKVRLLGASYNAAYPDHRVLVGLNGQTVGEMTWDDLTPTVREFQVPSAWLRKGLNEITLTFGSLPGVSNDNFMLDWIELTYQQSLTAINDQAAFTAAGGGRREFRVLGMTAQDGLVFDITNPGAPVRLNGVQTAAEDIPSSARAEAQPLASSTNLHQVFLPIAGAPGPASSASYSLSFGVASDTPRSYAITRVATAPRVAPLSRDTGSSLRSAANRADYLLISHRTLWPAAEALANHRRSRGLAVALVDVQDVYDEFSNGRLDPRAIRDFVAYAYGAWQTPAPSYLMLVGSSHYDYRLRTGLTTQPILVPTYFRCADPYTCEVAVENEFVTVSGSDRMPDLALGRLPARNLAEATVMVNKTISYETNPPPGPWKNTLTFVADNYRDANGAPDPAGNFEALSNGTLALVPPSYTANRVYFDPFPGDDGGESYRYRTAAATTDAIVAAVNNGTVLLNYIGHAGVTTWAHEAILRARDTGRNDVTRFANGPRLPVVLDMACASGNFADPEFTGIEVMMLAWTGGGSVAGWAATGFGVATGHDYLHRGFYQAVFGSNVRTLGLATAAGKQSLWNSGRNLDLLDTFDLLGDPALTMQLP